MNNWTPSIDSLQDRGTDGIIYLNRINSLYIKLIENSAIINTLNKKDQL